MSKPSMNPLFNLRPSVTTSLIIINVVVFLVGMVAQTNAVFCIPTPDGMQEPIFQVFGAYSYFTGIMQHDWWRMISYQFVHANFGHLLFNMWALMFFGPAVERILGPRTFLLFYLTCGVSGALFASCIGGLGLLEYGTPSLLLEMQINNLVASTGYEGTAQIWQLIPMVGASAAVYGVLIATAFMFPTARVQLLFPPINLSLRTLAIIIVAIATLTIQFSGNNAGGEAGHLGGIICSALIMMVIRRKLYRWSPW